MTTSSALLARGVPPQPKWLAYLSFGILVLSLACLGLSAYALDILSYEYYFDSGPPALMIFAAIKTLILYGGLLTIQYRWPQHYYRALPIVAYPISLVLWLAAWTWCAAFAAFWLGFSCSFYDCSGAEKALGGSLAAAAVIGALIWALGLINYVFLVLACLRSPEAKEKPPAAQAPVPGGDASRDAELGQKETGTTTSQQVQSTKPAVQPTQTTTQTEDILLHPAPAPYE